MILPLRSSELGDRTETAHHRGIVLGTLTTATMALINKISDLKF